MLGVIRLMWAGVRATKSLVSENWGRSGSGKAHKCLQSTRNDKPWFCSVFSRG